MNLAVFTSSALRHKAFASIAYNSSILNIVAVFHEEGEPIKELLKSRGSVEIERQHLLGRDQAEQDYFGLYLGASLNCPISKTVSEKWFSTQNCIDTLRELEIDLVLVYGTSMIRGAIIDKYKGKMLNVHLGLSPYYRGSGTNYFPFVNNEPEYCGATFMYLDAGVDTGEIIHQIRPCILANDSFHQLSNRFLIKVFKTYVKIAINYPRLTSTAMFKDGGNKTRRLYKNRDFTRESVERLYENFSTGMVQNYLDNYEKCNNQVPIIENIDIAWEG